MTDSKEFSWLREEGDSLPSRYEFRWIAVDGQQIGNDWNLIERIVVADGDTLGEVIALVLHQGKNPLELFYTFIRPSLSEPLQRQEDAEVYRVAGSTR
jgi:hypothetical protein